MNAVANKRIVIAVCLLAFVPSMVGCTAQQISGIRANLATARASAETLDQAIQAAKIQKDKLALEVAAMPASDEKRQAQSLLAELDRWILQYEATRDLTMAQVNQLEKDLAGAQDEIDVLKAAVSAATPFLPAPWAGLVGMGAALGAAIWQAIKRGKQVTAARDVATSIVKAVDAAKSDGKVDFADPATKKLLSTVMGGDAKTFVDEVQKTSKQDAA